MHEEQQSQYTGPEAVMMTKQLVNPQLLKKLVPFDSLSDKYFNELAGKVFVEFLPAEAKLFKRNETDRKRFYLLSGLVVLEARDTPAKIVKGGSEQATFPLDAHQPHQVTAVAKTNIVFLQIDDELIEDYLAWDQSAGYTVDEIADESENNEEVDWMTRILKSKSFRRIPAANLQAMFMRLEPVSFAAGETVITQDEPGDYYYIINRGKCAVKRISASGDEVKLTELGPGDSFGEEALVSDSKRNATVTMLTEGVLMRLSRENFEKLLKEPVLKSIDFEQAVMLVESGAEWLDVRLESEYHNNPFPNSINIPLSSLRSQIANVDRTKRYIVYCETGRRSSIAAYLLHERGFEVYLLDGGIRNQHAS